MFQEMDPNALNAAILSARYFGIKIFVGVGNCFLAVSLCLFFSVTRT